MYVYYNLMRLHYVLKYLFYNLEKREILKLDGWRDLEQVLQEIAAALK